MKNLVVAMALSAAVCAPAGADVLRDAAEATIKCQYEEDADKRLACLEAATQQLQAALAAPAPVIAATPTAPPSDAPSTAVAAVAPQVAQTAAADPTPVWAKAPDRPVTGPGKEAEPDEIQVTVVKATESFGRYTFTTSDGQIWKMTQTDRVKLPKSLPTPATIKRKLTGNPMIQFTNVSRGYRVERLH